MKTFLLSCLLLISLNGALVNCFSQWYQQDSLVSSAYFNVKFINKNTGWISGHQGVILKTTNAGINWFIQYSNPGKLMYGLHPVDSNVIYACGWFETIIKSTNGGANWTEIRNGPFGQGHSYETIYFINKDTGWVSGSGNIIFKTYNGGLTFDSLFIKGKVYDLYFKNSYEGLACGDGGHMHRTSNGGITWDQIFVPVSTQSADFYRLTFIDNYTGYTQGVQNRKIYKTTDFGLTWDSLVRVPATSNMNCIFFSSPEIGWCCGSDNQIFKTMNGGLNWRRENTFNFNPYGFGAVYFVTDSIGWAVGTWGKILYTSNGGLTFSENESVIIKDFSLENNYPNPFNSSTVFTYHINKPEVYKMEIFNSIGKLEELIFNSKHLIGSYKISYTAKNLSSGLYFMKLSSSGNFVTKKFLYVK